MKAPEDHFYGRPKRHSKGFIARSNRELQAYVAAERRELTRRLVEVNRDLHALQREAKEIDERLTELDKADDLLAGE